MRDEIDELVDWQLAEGEQPPAKTNYSIVGEYTPTPRPRCALLSLIRWLFTVFTP